MGNTINRAKDYRRPSGIGYITILPGIDRDKFVRECYNSRRVAIITEDLQIIKNVLIDNDKLEQIDFPKHELDRGTPVFWVNDPSKNVPVIVGVMMFDNEFGSYKEHLRSLTKKTEHSSARIAVDGEEGIVYISARSDKEGSAKLNINVIGEGAEMNINIKGDSNIVSSGKINLTSSSDVNVKAEGKIIHNEGDEPISRGQELKTQLEREKETLTILMDAIGNAPTVPEDGGTAFKAGIVSAISAVIRGDYSEINSEKSFIK